MEEEEKWVGTFKYRGPCAKGQLPPPPPLSLELFQEK